MSYILVGHGDTNQARTRVTERYTSESDFLFVVAPIGKFSSRLEPNSFTSADSYLGRVETDANTNERLFNECKSLGRNVALLCTRSEDVRGTGVFPSASANAIIAWDIY